METTIIFLSIFQKNFKFLKNLKKSAKYRYFLTEGDFDYFLLVLKIPHPDFLIFLAQIPSFLLVHMWLKPRADFGIFLGLN